MELKTTLWLAIVIGSWLISGAVAFTTVRLSIKMLTKETAENRKKILIVEQSINKRLYNTDGTPIYMSAKICKDQNIERDKRKDDATRITCDKILDLKKTIEKLSQNQLELNKSVSYFIGKVDQYIKSTEDKQL